MTTKNVQRLVLIAIAVLSLSGCSLFHREPPLPRRAVIEAGGSEEKFAGLIEEADIIYLPSETALFASRSEPAWKLLTALGLSGSSFAIGWEGSSAERDRRDFFNEVSKSGGQVLALDGSDQLVAEKIASYFQEHGSNKVLVFIRRERLGLGQGVPYLVAQQTKARQLILNPRKSSSGARLLAGN